MREEQKYGKKRVQKMPDHRIGGSDGRCGKDEHDGRVEVELVSYKPEAVHAFEEIADRFNETHDDIYLKVDSPNEAMTILKTRFIREDYPDIIGIGGDMNYSNFLDADLFYDISDLEILETVNPEYLAIDKELELLPKEGTYALPYAANAAGILYNKEIFAEHGWEVPTNWDEFTALCERMQEAGVLLCTLVIRTHGPVWHPGMHWQWACVTPMCAIR